MTMLPARTGVSDTYPNPTNGVARASLGTIWDVLNEAYQAAEVSVAAAATIDIGGQTSMKLLVTGTAAITSLGTNYRGPVVVRFSGTPTLTHNANTLLLPNSANISVVAGDVAIFAPKAVSGTINGWQCVSYVPSTAAGARTNLGLGTAAVLNVGTSANSVVQLDSSGKLPAVDGSALTGIYSNSNADIFTGTGAKTTFTLSANPGALNNLDVSVGGISQRPGIDYTWPGGTTITFTTAPPSGTNNILVRYMQGLPQGIADSGSVTYSRSASYGSSTVGKKLQQTVDVVADFGADPTGVADSTTAIQNAINSVGTGACIEFPTGTYKVTSQITVPNDRVHLVGKGSWATQIMFAPTANSTCFKCSKASAAVLYQGSIRGMSFYSNDSTYTKTAINLVDVSGYILDDIVIAGAVAGLNGSRYWSGANSVGIQTNGREACVIRKIYNYADLPIVIAANPNSTISLDHTHFQDCYLAANGNACVTINTGCNLTHITFDGYQPWVGGVYGLYWNDTTTSQQSIALSVKNVRWEQISGTTGYLFYIAHNSGLAQLMLENCYGGLTANFVYLRKIQEFTLTNLLYIGTSVGADIDSTCTSGTFTQFVCNNNSATVTIGAKRVSGDYKIGGNIFNLIPNAPAGSNVTQLWNQSSTLGFNQLSPKTFSVAANSTVTFSNTTLRGLVFIYVSSGPVSAVMAVNGPSNSTKLLIQSDAGWFATTLGGANINLYYDSGSGSYKLQNNVAAPLTFYVTTMGGSEQA
jgi:Pectate lyase superfamily protein